VTEGTERTQCTDKTCTGEARYALWMGDQFSRVRNAPPAMSYDDGDLHPHVCENCLPRYERHHGDKGEFVRPSEKLAVGGRCSVGTEQSTQWTADFSGPYLRCENCDTTLVKVHEAGTINCAKCAQTLFGGHTVELGQSKSSGADQSEGSDA